MELSREEQKRKVKESEKALIESTKAQIGEGKYDLIMKLIPRVLKTEEIPMHKDTISAFVEGATFVTAIGRKFAEGKILGFQEGVTDSEYELYVKGVLIAVMSDFRNKFQEELDNKINSSTSL